MEVTEDKYELPVAIADSLRELANMRKVSPSGICKRLHNTKATVKYVRVEIDEKE